MNEKAKHAIRGIMAVAISWLAMLAIASAQESGMTAIPSAVTRLDVSANTNTLVAPGTPATPEDPDATHPGIAPARPKAASSWGPTLQTSPMPPKVPVPPSASFGSKPAGAIDQLAAAPSRTDAPERQRPVQKLLVNQPLHKKLLSVQDEHSALRHNSSIQPKRPALVGQREVGLEFHPGIQRVQESLAVKETEEIVHKRPNNGGHNQKKLITDRKRTFADSKTDPHKLRHMRLAHGDGSENGR